MQFFLEKATWENNSSKSHFHCAAFLLLMLLLIFKNKCFHFVRHFAIFILPNYFDAIKEPCNDTLVWVWETTCFQFQIVSFLFPTFFSYMQRSILILHPEPCFHILPWKTVVIITILTMLKPSQCTLYNFSCHLALDLGIYISRISVLLGRQHSHRIQSFFMRSPVWKIFHINCIQRFSFWIIALCSLWNKWMSLR